MSTSSTATSMQRGPDQAGGWTPIKCVAHGKGMENDTPLLAPSDFLTIFFVFLVYLICPRCILNPKSFPRMQLRWEISDVDAFMVLLFSCLSGGRLESYCANPYQKKYLKEVRLFVK